MSDVYRFALYHFCRVQLPAVPLGPKVFQHHLQRAFDLCRSKSDSTITWKAYLANLYPLDWFVASACLEGDARAWEYLFAARVGRADCLLVDAFRARAVRLYPGDVERQESAVAEFWSHLLVAESDASLPILARYDGQRPLVPWLIRVFQNRQVSLLRKQSHAHPLPEDDLSLDLPAERNIAWHEAFCLAAREWLDGLDESELLILGLRWRYRQSQREAAKLLGVHEGTISRQTDRLRDRCLEYVGQRLQAQGWSGDDLMELILSEMGGLLLEEPRLSADHIAGLLAARGKKVPAV